MRRIELDELRQLELEILDYVVKFCDEHSITYWLDFGTLIGAVRHKGYIPWDDDIDISMRRNDYEKFVKLFNDCNRNDRYKLHCIENDYDYDLLFGKVFDNKTVRYYPNNPGLKREVDIDIFILDNAPNEDKELSSIFRKRIFYRFLNFQRHALKRPSGNFLRRICVKLFRFFLKIFPKNYFLKKSDRIIQQYNSISTKRVSNFTAWQECVCRREAFDEFIDMDFEGRKYKVPAGYDEWLRINYGDYMQLPPPKKRVRHEGECYMLED